MTSPGKQKPPDVSQGLKCDAGAETCDSDVKKKNGKKHTETQPKTKDGFQGKRLIFLQDDVHRKVREAWNEIE